MTTPLTPMGTSFPWKSTSLRARAVQHMASEDRADADRIHPIAHAKQRRDRSIAADRARRSLGIQKAARLMQVRSTCRARRWTMLMPGHVVPIAAGFHRGSRPRRAGCVMNRIVSE